MGNSTEGEKEGTNLEAQVSGVEDVHPKNETIHVDHQLEHELTVKDVFTRHPAIVFWVS